MSSGYEFTKRSELETAVDIWISDQGAATEDYGNINSWDVSAITDFSFLFFGENNFNSDGKPRIKDNQKAGLACDHWNRFKDDVSLLKELGVSHYRLSLEWSKIETEKNKFNEDALNHYSEVIDFLLENNIVPYVTLHHFTNPIWFDELGSFEKEKNIDFFINFCELVFNRYSDKVSNWCTINEPEVYSVMGYFSGIFPPGKKDAQLSAEVQKNLLIAHTRVYHKLKSLPNGKKCKIGIVKNVMQFDPSRRWHLLDWLACRITDTVYNKMSLSYLKYGKISISADYGKNVNSCNYYNGFIYLMSNFSEIIFYFSAKLNFFKKKIYEPK